ncbi:hypothetical protein L873DRAFT_778949 [Choiromyces venosus 120613-1]|uniref:Uncharacterized protein n=1 Tax=Choiromyces venosus 120613-1 TaxID=1336337 RepID=A0A3N4JQH3_9PEZI|nr:hypothetical protein L873DRAFT_778949 [Choiromyces venosus 120613-1]
MLASVIPLSMGCIPDVSLSFSSFFLSLYSLTLILSLNKNSFLLSTLHPASHPPPFLTQGFNLFPLLSSSPILPTFQSRSIHFVFLPKSTTLLLPSSLNNIKFISTQPSLLCGPCLPLLHNHTNPFVRKHIARYLYCISITLQLTSTGVEFFISFLSHGIQKKEKNHITGVMRSEIG